MSRGVRCVGGKPTVVDVAPRPAAGDDTVRVRVASAGICGSDLHLMAFDLPSVMGHEFAGLLDDGTAVAVEPLAPCNQCDACRAGDYNLCASGPGIILGVGRDGGMADECVVPASAVAPLPATLAPTDACLVEPLAIGVHGVRRGNIQPGQRVAIVGAGTIGLCALVAAQARGARVDVAARYDHQRETAQRLGGNIDELTAGYDVVIEAAGSAGALDLAAKRCRAGGTIVLLGSYWDGTVEMPGQRIALKEIDLAPASLYARQGDQREFEIAVALLASRADLVPALITHRFPLNAAAEAFATARDRAAGAIKVVLEP